MRDAGRMSAAIEILNDFESRRIPIKTAIADWGRANRYAGAKDRAWISGLCLDALRKRQSLLTIMDPAAESEGPNGRALVLSTLRFLWEMPIEELAENASEEPHGPGPLSDEEQKCLSQSNMDQPSEMDAPDFLQPMAKRVFGEDYLEELSALSKRADIDLRINTLKTTPEKALSALRPVSGKAAPFVMNAARIHAPPPNERAPAITVIPAFNKGWVEVQDLGSQLAACAAGNIAGKQVLDFCAGGGGKSLALAALMENRGQLHAYDIEARRLKPIYARAKRAGLRNLQIHTPAYKEKTIPESLSELEDKMDVVFVDAPCTGTGTWRRHPDTKWRITPNQLERRLYEQDLCLNSAHPFVKKGGHLVYVTCSFLAEENEDRLEKFLNANASFKQINVLNNIKSSAALTEDAMEALTAWETTDGALRLTPRRTNTDAFFISVLERID